MTICIKKIRIRIRYIMLEIFYTYDLLQSEKVNVVLKLSYLSVYLSISLPRPFSETRDGVSSKFIT